MSPELSRRLGKAFLFDPLASLPADLQTALAHRFEEGRETEADIALLVASERGKIDLKRPGDA